MSIQLNDCASQSVPERPQAHQWYAVYTYPRHEKTVVKHLQDNNVETFLPVFTVLSQWTDRRVRITRPLFPGYVFTRINLVNRVAVQSAPGVIRIVSFNSMPATIDEAEIEAVRRCVAMGKAKPHPFLEIGERVRVRRGLFEGLEGIVLRRDNNCELVVSVGLISRSIAIEIATEELEALAPKQRLGLRETGPRSATLGHVC